MLPLPLGAAARNVLHHGQRSHLEQHDAAALETIAAVDAMWAQQLFHLRQEATAALRVLQERHEDALRSLRMEQVVRARDSGIRPVRRNKELLNLRRSEAVLASHNNFTAASRVKAAADRLQDAESNGTHADWLLRCHGEQERLLTQQRRELEALRKRLASRLREVEAARDRDLEKLGRKIKVNIVRTQQLFAKERQHMEAALNGCLLNSKSTRPDGRLEECFPTMVRLAGGPKGSPPVAPDPQHKERRVQHNERNKWRRCQGRQEPDGCAALLE
ncbi:hypothetical protein GPECTOR_35g832 [Gonium pectorale]|uniref:Uncharacterized protein n=1 Tax=Gonium pectorale TaxID=33097 RepID=A0A150GC37_GONPE|nr:hypothetical protein GPECTOR_35g832 [Gonium pectorale]|eukprot:KXZ47394.1 hypothetical protein GPECTOR_35g832 [Gonium pectorale]